MACAVIHAARSEEIHPIENNRNSENPEETGENFDKLIKTAIWPKELLNLTGWEAKDIEDVAYYLIKLNL